MKTQFSRALRFCSLVLSLVFASACGGGGHSALPSGPASMTPATGGAAQASVRITIPSAATAFAKRHPQYVSPSTNSISIAQGGAAATVASLAPNSPDCAAAGSNRICTVPFGATAAVNATFTVKLYASADGSGTPLSAQSIVQTITVGAANQLNVVLNGVVATLSCVLANPTMTVGQTGSTDAIVNGVDAAGNTIVGPGVFADMNGNPITVTLADSDTTGATHLAQTTATGPAAIAFTYNGASIPSPTITASAPAIAPVSATLALTAAGAKLNAAQVNAVLTSTQATFASMPHTTLAADLQTLATQMVSSGAYATATVTPGGIQATLPDGSTTFLFADRMEDFAGIYPSAAARRPVAARAVLRPASSRHTLDVAPHTVAMLTNTLDTLAFTVSNQNAIAQGWSNGGIGIADNYGVSNQGMTLEAIAALGAGKIDVLDIATHGVLGFTDSSHTANYDAMVTTTPVSDAVTAQYAADAAAGRLITGATLGTNTTGGHPGAYYVVTWDFLTAHLSFSPGAIVFNNSCYGGNPGAAASTAAILKPAGVGRYFGWTKSVDGKDADQTDAFIVDRIVGEDGLNSTGLNAIVAQRTPAQRPFPLDDVQSVIQTETRSGPLGTKTTTYAVSDNGDPVNATVQPAADGTAAKLVVADYGGESVTDAPIEYAMPEITNMSVTESAANGTLTLFGHFPAAQGKVQVSDDNGLTNPAVTSWTTSQIVATLPADGAGATGQVNLLTADGLPTGNVPLTQWGATLAYSESDDITSLGGKDGNGTGSVEIDYDVHFRGDVHPIVPAIDTTPAPQAFAFANVEGDSTAQYVKYDGRFASEDGKSSAVFALSMNSPLLTPALPPLQPGNFEVRAVTELEQPSPCNNGQSGLQGPGSNILCPIVGVYGQASSVSCTDTGSENVCDTPNDLDVLSAYGVPDLAAGGLLQMTMDPKAYTVSLAAQEVDYGSNFFEGEDFDTDFGVIGVGSMSGTVSAPKYAPSYGVSGSGAVRRALSRTNVRIKHSAWKAAFEAARAHHEI